MEEIIEQLLVDELVKETLLTAMMEECKAKRSVEHVVALWICGLPLSPKLLQIFTSFVVTVVSFLVILYASIHKP